MVILCELWILDAFDAGAEGLHERGGGGLGAVGVVGRVEAVEDEHGGDHVLDAVVAVGEVVHGLELLVDDADARFVRADRDVFDVGGGFAAGGELRVDVFGGFDGGLGVEFGWEGEVWSVGGVVEEEEGGLTGIGDFEEDVLHYVAAVGSLKFEGFAFEEHVVEAPDGGGEHGGYPWLPSLYLQDEVDCPLTGVSCGPRLP